MINWLLNDNSSFRSFILSRRSQPVRIELKPSQKTSEDTICRFARASAVLLRISDRLEKEAAQREDKPVAKTAEKEMH